MPPLLALPFVSPVVAFIQVLIIDLVMSGDNVIAIGLAAASLAAEKRKKAIFWGLIIALVLRVILSLLAVTLFHVPGVPLIGGVLLFWVGGKLWGEIRHGPHVEGKEGRAKSLFAAVLQITLADLSMALDNVLAVAGAATREPIIMAIGLVLSVVLMGVSAKFIADILSKQRWLGYVGVAIILIVALRMVYDGAHGLKWV